MLTMIFKKITIYITNNCRALKHNIHLAVNLMYLKYIQMIFLIPNPIE